VQVGELEYSEDKQSKKREAEDSAEDGRKHYCSEGDPMTASRAGCRFF
jgi:hypothetical protein